jgi:anti-sigma-K factor RskA
MKEQIPAYLLGALEPAELADFQHHLDGCDECQAELRWLEPAVVRLSADVAQVEPDGALKRRVMDAVEQEPGADGVPESPRRPAKRRRWFELPEISRGFAVAGAMALVVAVLVAGVAGYSLNGNNGSSDGPGTGTVTAARTTDGSNAVLVSNGGSGTLRVSNLDPPGEGKVYQAWVEREGVIRPTDSLFLPRRDGTATTSVPDLEGASTVYVSVEPDGGSSSPTTTPVIAVALKS